jgi:hypothetical protein
MKGHPGAMMAAMIWPPGVHDRAIRGAMLIVARQLTHWEAGDGTTPQGPSDRRTQRGRISSTQRGRSRRRSEGDLTGASKPRSYPESLRSLHQMNVRGGGSDRPSGDDLTDRVGGNHRRSSRVARELDGAPARGVGRHRVDTMPPASPRCGAEPARGQRDGAPLGTASRRAMPFRQPPAASSWTDDLTSAGQ